MNPLLFSFILACILVQITSSKDEELYTSKLRQDNIPIEQLSVFQKYTKIFSNSIFTPFQMISLRTGAYAVRSTSSESVENEATASMSLRGVAVNVENIKDAPKAKVTSLRLDR